MNKTIPDLDPADLPLPAGALFEVDIPGSPGGSRRVAYGDLLAPAGSTKQIQYNNAGAFGAEAGFEYDAATNTLTVANLTTSGLVLTAASASGGAGFRLPHGAAPTSPVNGDVWTTSAGGLYARINGVTVGPFAAGSGLTNFTEGVDTSTPNGTIPVVTLLAANAGSDVDMALTPKGNGALTAQKANNGTGGGNKRGINAVDWQMQRNDATQVASGAGSTIAGGYSNKASNGNATVGGGQQNYGTGQWSTIGGGNQNVASGNYSYVGGGQTNTASGINSSVIGGDTNTASGVAALALGGFSCVASGDYSTAYGYRASTKGMRGAHAIANAYWSTTGDTQFVRQLQTFRTTDATPATVNGDGTGSASTANSMVLDTASVRGGRVKVLAFKTSSGDSALWEANVLVANIGGTVALVGSPTFTQIFATSGAVSGSWAVAFAVNNTTKALEIQITGEASSSIRWISDFSGLMLVG